MWDGVVQGERCLGKSSNVVIFVLFSRYIDLWRGTAGGPDLGES